MIDSVRVDRADLAAADRRVEHRRRPSRATSAASRSVATGEMLLMSMTMAPFWRAERTPSGPVSTRSTSGVSGSIVMTMEDARATSAGEVAAVGAGRDELVHRATAAVVDGQLVPGLDQVLRHGLSHDAKSDESNVFRHGSDQIRSGLRSGLSQTLTRPADRIRVPGAIILMRGCI